MTKCCERDHNEDGNCDRHPELWVLRDGSRYFAEMTGIGPRCTPKIGEAAKFRSKREAMLSPAYSFATTSFEPEVVR